MKKKGAPCHGYWVGLDRSIPSVLSSKGAPGGRHCKFLWENWPNDERDDEFRPPGSSSLSVSYTAELNEVNASQAIKTWKKKVRKREEVKEGYQARLDGPVIFPTTRFSAHTLDQKMQSGISRRVHKLYPIHASAVRPSSYFPCRWVLLGMGELSANSAREETLNNFLLVLTKNVFRRFLFHLRPPP